MKKAMTIKFPVGNFSMYYTDLLAVELGVTYEFGYQIRTVLNAVHRLCDTDWEPPKDFDIEEFFERMAYFTERGRL